MLEKSIDILLHHIYIDKNSDCVISDFLNSKGINYDNGNCNIIGGKIAELGLFKLIDVSTIDIRTNYIINANSAGFEFVNKYGSYLNYLLEQKKVEEKEARKESWSIKSAMGSYGGMFVNIIATLFTIIFGINSCQKEDKIKVLELKNDSLSVALNIKAKLLEQLRNKFENQGKTTDTLEHNTNREFLIKK